MLSRRASLFIAATASRPPLPCNATGCINTAGLHCGTGMTTPVQRFCSSLLCGVPRYLLVLSGHEVRYVSLIAESGVVLIESGAASWISFVCNASLSEVMEALCTMDSEVVRRVDDLTLCSMADLANKIAALQDEDRQRYAMNASSHEDNNAVLCR